MNDCYEVWHLNIMNGQYADVTVFAIVGNKCLIFAPFYTSIFYVKQHAYLIVKYHFLNILQSVFKRHTPNEPIQCLSDTYDFCIIDLLLFWTVELIKIKIYVSPQQMLNNFGMNRNKMLKTKYSFSCVFNQNNIQYHSLSSDR